MFPVVFCFSFVLSVTLADLEVKLLVSKIEALENLLQAAFKDDHTGVYHTSVQVGDYEYFYHWHGGIRKGIAGSSHIGGLLPLSPAEGLASISTYNMGTTRFNKSNIFEEIKKAFEMDFPQHGYNAFHRNCNDFATALVWFLMKINLDDKFMELLGLPERFEKSELMKNHDLEGTLQSSIDVGTALLSGRDKPLPLFSNVGGFTLSAVMNNIGDDNAVKRSESPFAKETFHSNLPQDDGLLTVPPDHSKVRRHHANRTSDDANVINDLQLLVDAAGESDRSPHQRGTSSLGSSFAELTSMQDDVFTAHPYQIKEGRQQVKDTEHGGMMNATQQQLLDLMAVTKSSERSPHRRGKRAP